MYETFSEVVVDDVISLEVERSQFGTKLIVARRGTQASAFARRIFLMGVCVTVGYLFPGELAFRASLPAPASAPNLQSLPTSPLAARASALPMWLVALVLALLIIVLLELFLVSRESVTVLPGGVGYVLESVARCGLVWRRRFIDGRDVAFITLSEAVTSGDVRFFLAFALEPPDATPDPGCEGARLAVPFVSLLPRLRLRHLQPIYQELVRLRDQSQGGQAPSGTQAVAAAQPVVMTPPAGGSLRCLQEQQQSSEYRDLACDDSLGGPVQREGAVLEAAGAAIALQLKQQRQSDGQPTGADGSSLGHGGRGAGGRRRHGERWNGRGEAAAKTQAGQAD